MISLTQVRDLVVVPALTALGHNDRASMLLVIGTGLIETEYAYLAQIGGPALSPWQIEPFTANDTWVNFLAWRLDLRAAVLSMMVPGADKIEQLAWNWQYAAAMCRIKYLRAPANLPNASDLEGLAAYYKTVYNTAAGAATTAKFIQLATEYGLMDL